MAVLPVQPGHAACHGDDRAIRRRVWPALHARHRDVVRWDYNSCVTYQDSSWGNAVASAADRCPHTTVVDGSPGLSARLSVAAAIIDA